MQRTTGKGATLIEDAVFSKPRIFYTFNAMGDKQVPRWPWSPAQVPPHCTPWIDEMVHRVYQSTICNIPIEIPGDGLQSLTLPEVYTILERKLAVGGVPEDMDQGGIGGDLGNSQDNEAGRLGPKDVAFDINSNVGSLVISQDRLGVTSQSNFNTVKANCCVYRGRWQYEVSLGSKGVMQVGWATAKCEFNDEQGVGDTPDSFAFDGNRIRKWNVSNMKYGQAWLAGDVIGCCLDLDAGTVSFYRNGVSLGEAFRNIRRGPGYAYFPAVSLSFGENLVANFGSSRLRYPIEGYSPLVAIPDTSRAQLVTNLIYKVVSVYSDAERTTINQMSDDGAQILLRGSRSQALLVAAPVVEYFPLLVETPYVLEVTLLPLLERFLEEDPDQIVAFLSILWTLLEWQQIHQALEKLASVLISSYSFAASDVDYTQQKKVLFEKGRFSTLMKVKPLDIQHLEEVVPQVWLEVALEEGGPCVYGSPAEEAVVKAAYFSSRDRIKSIVADVEGLQVELLATVTQDDDSCPPLGQTSRDKFLCEFEKLLKEHSLAHSATTLQSSLSTVAISYLHRLISIIRQCLPVVNPADGSELREHSLFVPLFHFLSEQWTPGEGTRVGGLFSSLRCTLQAELRQVLSSMASVRQPREDLPYHMSLPQVERTKANATVKVLKLIDSVVRLYTAVVHEQLEKAAALRDSMKDYMKAYRSTLESLARNKADDWARTKLECSRDVFREKLNEQARQMAWLSATMFSKEKQLDLYWLLQVVLHTLEEASKSGPCFGFVPDFYVEASVKLFNALSNFFPPTACLSDIPGHYNLQVRYSTFLASHFSDPRVVNSDLKDVLIQALAHHVCPPDTLRSLECMSSESSQAMVAALLRPYGRAWAHANWILVRLWKGCGFAFRYSIDPHLVDKKMSLLKPRVAPVLPPHPPPCPSVFFQNLISKYLDEHPANAVAFVESVLSQLNWAFSEFVSMLQEIQTAHNRPESLYRILIDSRHLKVCSTCFDLTVSLLRVVEMLANLSPSCLLKPSGSTASAMFLPRLIQTLSHILNRVCYGKGCFELVVSLDIVGLQNIGHFCIISAVAGILIALLLKGPKKNREMVLRQLFQEPSFIPQSIESFLGPSSSSSSSSSLSSSSSSAAAANNNSGSSGGGSNGASTSLSSVPSISSLTGISSSSSKLSHHYPTNHTSSAVASLSRSKSNITTGTAVSGHADASTFSLANYGDVKEEEIDQVRQLIQLIKKSFATGEESSQHNPLGLYRHQSVDEDSDSVCTICYAAAKSAVFRPCGHESCRECIQLHLVHQRECFYCKAPIKSVEATPPVEVPPAPPAPPAQGPHAD
ncbi:E3 ubiquitin-protein ligase RNF123-like isoform X3 [Varroa destructor]|uniref:RING-type E3 ubiquitin transferase n=1 Tax=Varroa destructor TaxID=109461 RepID=A0A7M7K4P9_VARDE|nr:E3 ubiquitin-protein ligase RNF123-like isoform X3 [Varroa destructor]